MVTEVNPELNLIGTNSNQQSPKSQQSGEDSEFAQALSKADSKSSENLATQDSQSNLQQASKKGLESSSSNAPSSDSKDISLEGDSAALSIKSKNLNQDKEPESSPLAKILSDDKDDLDVLQDSKESDKEQSKQKAIVASSQGASLNNKTNQALDSSLVVDDKDQNIKSNLQKDKTLNDVKNEANARNLNLQKMEITQNGTQSKIDIDKLFDKEILDVNKEKLSDSLQNKGALLAKNIQSLQVPTTIATELGDPIDPQMDRARLLADLLNKYDTQENAKRKALNASEKLEWKLDNGDKAIIIERSSNQPINIVRSKLRNEERQNEFLERLYEITGNDDLGDLVTTNKERAQALMRSSMEFSSKADSKIQANVANLVQQTQPIDMNKDVASPFEFDTTKAFDEAITKSLNADSTIAKNKVDSNQNKESTSIDDSSNTDSKIEASSAQTKQDVTMKSAQAKEAIRNFASQFREEVLNYKPPITKINLELNPANLGQVSLSIAKKGKDLQVSVISNANVMSMFVQNAQDLRQSLMQIGFNNLDLNFSSHNDKQQQQQGNDQQEQNFKLSSIDEAQDMLASGSVPESLEILLPEYA